MTTIDRIRTYLVCDPEMIEIDPKTVRVLCDLADYGAKARREREAEKENHQWYIRVARRQMIAMYLVLAVTLLVAVLRATRII